MPQFRFVAKGSDGRLVDGLITCNDRAAAIRQVEKEHGFPIKIEPVSSPVESKPGRQTESSPAADRPAPVGELQNLSHTQLHLFTEQLAHLLTSGMTLDEALGVMVKRMKHPKLGGISRSLHQALVEGRSLSQALREFPKIFSPLYVNMVAAGEVSGALAEILRRLVIYLGEAKSLRDRVQQALVYPFLLVVVGALLIALFMVKVVPQLTDFFVKTGQELPNATKLLLGVNYTITHYWWVAVIAVIGGRMLFKAATRSREGLRAWDAFVWRVPLISILIRHRFYAQFARTLGTLMDNGVTLLRALELLEESAGNEFIRQKLVHVRNAVVDGATLSTAVAEFQIFPELYGDMMAVGEQSGRFAQSMHSIADIYDRELDKQVRIVSTLIPPLILLVMAAVIGVVVYAILSAVFGMSNSLRNRIQ
ncbi:MAG: type II secretion system F family protein [Chthoniobacteraceae bacterium]